jgi:NAD(P)-dependent dehydrogenase (short-subunit alcohol dehydrogenase family)
VTLTPGIAPSGPRPLDGCAVLVTGARCTPKLSRMDHAQHPVGRAGTPEDIAHLGAYRLSALADFVSGQNFMVDGGMTRKMQYA